LIRGSANSRRGTSEKIKFPKTTPTPVEKKGLRKGEVIKKTG